MSVLCLDVDSKIPNLALMKVSRYFKDHGKKVILSQRKAPMSPDPSTEEAWISCVFTWNKSHALEMESFLKIFGIHTHLGGSGIDLINKLPPEIESLTPDYDLYGDDRAVGFIQRGCIRKCQFCIVPEKEGLLWDNEFRPLDTWVPEGFSKVLLLDNEFAALPFERQEAIFKQARETGWKLSITQGYDLRCINDSPKLAGLLAEYKPYDIKFRGHRLYCAWDYFGVEGYIRKGIEHLLKAGFKGSEITCYLLCGFGSTHLQDYYRFHTLWNTYGVLPFFMRYNLRRDDPFLNALSRYTNRGPAIYRNNSFLDYCERLKPKLVPEVKEIIAFVESGQHPSPIFKRNAG